MSPAPRTERARLVLAARRQRVHRLRRGVAAVTAAMFIALFGVVYGQMAAGDDPALGASVLKAATTKTVKTTTTTQSTGTSIASDTPSNALSSSDATTSTGSNRAPVTSQQS